jgi:signal transduction histidine kinase
MDEPVKESPIRILLVVEREDDQQVVRRTLTASSLAFAPSVCAHTEEIPAALASSDGKFDIVLIYRDPPGLRGLEAVLQTRTQQDMPALVMLTGTDSENLAAKTLKAGFDDYIVKAPGRDYLRQLPLQLHNVHKRHLNRRTRQIDKARLEKIRDDLKEMVDLRTRELTRLVEALEREIDERKQTEQALRISEKTLRVLSRKIVDTQESERRAIAKELHDSIGASLAAIKFAIEEKLHTMDGPPPAGTVNLETVVKHIRDTIKEVRRISSSLRPSMLDELGLLATVRWFCRSSREMYLDTRIETIFNLQEDDIPEPSKIVVYRILQEALNNALKHSKADRVQVRLEKMGEGIRMCVSDNGCGFDPQDRTTTSDPMSGHGLRGMYDRTEVVGGCLVIDSAPGQGTRVCMEMPAETLLDADALLPPR